MTKPLYVHFRVTPEEDVLYRAAAAAGKTTLSKMARRFLNRAAAEQADFLGVEPAEMVEKFGIARVPRPKRPRKLVL